MVANPQPQRMTLAEWAELDDEIRGELVDGFLVEEEGQGPEDLKETMPGYRHEIVIAWLIARLMGWGASRGVLVAGSGVKFAVGPKRGRMPDLTVFLPGRPDRPPAQGLVEIPPDIAVEVVSTHPRAVRRDRIDKVHEYAAFGIAGYWIVDPGIRTFEMFELGGDGRYVHALAATEGVLENIPQCPGLTLDVTALWALLDTLG